MEEIRNTAQIYYETVPENVKRSVVDLFNKMDSDKNGKVNQAEFARFMTEGRYVAMNNPTFFKKINKNKNGELDFEDVKTLCYILVSRRPLCDGCREFIEGMYFTCFECFTKAQSFCLHPRCFRKKKYDHKRTHSHFVDNYALLESIRHNGLPTQNESSKPSKSKPSTSTSLEIVPASSKPSKSKPSTSTSLEIVPASLKPSKSTPSTSTSLVIVPTPRDERPQKAPLELAIGMAANIAVIVAALAQCTIM